MIEPSFTDAELSLTLAALKEKRDRSADQQETADLINLIDYIEEVHR